MLAREHHLQILSRSFAETIPPDRHEQKPLSSLKAPAAFYHRRTMLTTATQRKTPFLMFSFWGGGQEEDDEGAAELESPGLTQVVCKAPCLENL